MIGQNLGHFRVLSKLGEGGQGAVYLATDTRLDRKVALKVLPTHALEDESLRRRFILEAKSSASLDHPNICTIYSIEEVEGQTLLAMAYLEGETIRQKVVKGPLPLDEAIDFALQTLKGLDAAHREGIVHRDIKSSNLMVVRPQLVKVMDFGLALAADRTRITQANAALGTPAYMSPEQAKGEAIDRRSDLWSAGVVLYEMVSGRAPFRGENAHSTMMAILTRDPEPLTGLRTGVPIELDRIVTKALARSPEERYQHADDFAADLRRVQRDLREGLSGSPVGNGLSPDRMPVRSDRSAQLKGNWGRAIPWAVAALATLLLLFVTASFWLVEELPSAQATVMRFSINLPEETPLNIGVIEGGSLILSPDGEHLVYTGLNQANTQLFRRSFPDGEVREIPETLGARTPFFSPDSQTLGYFVDNELFQATLRGFGTRVAPVFGRRLGAAWAEDGSIYFGPPDSLSIKGPLEVLSPGKEVAAPLTKLQTTASQFYELHCFPQVLPGGRGILYASQRKDGGSAMLYRLDTGEQLKLAEDVIGVRFLPPRFLVFARPPNQLLAAELELEGLKTTGEPALVLEGVWLGDNGVDTWSVSDTGTLVYVAGNENPYATRLAWVDHRGNVEEIVDSGTAFLSPRVSPDGRYLLVQYEGTRIGLFDVRARVWSRLTGGAGSEWWAAWHPDGETVIFNSDRESRGTVNLYRVKIGGGTPERLAKSEYNQEPHFVSKDGKYLLYTEAPVPETGYDIWTLRLDLEEPPRPLLTTRANTFHPVLSPDLHWLAYVSDESGRAEVYVQSFPEMNRQVRVSSSGGVDPLWSPDGRTLYFRSTNGRDAYRVSFEAGTVPTASSPEFLFSGPFVEPNTYGRTWDISPDGRRFLVLKVVNPINQNELKVILNWNREVAEKLSGSRR